MSYCEMSYRLLFWGVWLGFLLPAGTSAEEQPTEVTGILGQSATFHLQSPRLFDAVLWSRGDQHVATLRRGPTCQLQKFATFTWGEVSVSPDCSSLTLKNPQKEDAGVYRAQFQNQSSTQVVATQTFILKVYKHLSGADLKVTCAEDIRKDGNTTLHLNCSVGKWGEGVEFSWTSSGGSGKVSSSETSLVLHPSSLDNDWNVTCTAENPVGSASKTISLKQACSAAGQQPTTRPPTVADTETDPSQPSLAQTVTIAVIVAVVGIVAVAAAVLKCRRKKAAGGELITPSRSSGPKDCKSFYAEIPKVPEVQDVETERSQRQRGPGAPKEVPVTIYADVQQIPLQTDDEKIRREKRKAAEKSEKTIYSEISDLKEADKGNLKTIYDTVCLPRLPEASEYNKIL